MPPRPSGSSPIRVALAVRAPLLREGLACLLGRRPGVVIVREDEEGVDEEGVDLAGLAARLAPDVLLADAPLLADGVLDGSVRVVALLDEHQDAPACRRALARLDAGVGAFVSTGDEAETVFAAVRAAARGDEVYFSPCVAARLATWDGLGADTDQLTPRERDVLACVALGHSNAHIAADLGLAPGTVRNHLSALYAKLDVKTRGEAVAWAWRSGLVGASGRAPGPDPAEPGKKADP